MQVERTCIPLAQLTYKAMWSGQRQACSQATSRLYFCSCWEKSQEDIPTGNVNSLPWCMMVASPYVLFHSSRKIGCQIKSVRRNNLGAKLGWGLAGYFHRPSMCIILVVSCPQCMFQFDLWHNSQRWRALKPDHLKWAWYNRFVFPIICHHSMSACCCQAIMCQVCDFHKLLGRCVIAKACMISKHDFHWILILDESSS